ncbi:MAG: hypothetical protein KJO21_06495 [Verrucomicrobiae bacterium]|nr:hypothetical protein [Verrucomicrobiae bacterium]NNJ41786.1 hypothetical protein [Akkermansiaceae bacterium]
MADAHSDPEKGTGKFSPFAGCSIFIIAGTLAACMLAFTIWTYFKVKDTIAAFTEVEPKAIELADTQGREAAQSALEAKLVGFRQHIETHEEAEITLNADEMNLAIATFVMLKPHRHNLSISAIKDGHIAADISYPVKARMGSDEMRYLNGSITVVPELVEGAAFPRVTEIRADQPGDIPDEFKKFISETLLRPLHEDKELGPIFKRLSAVEIKNNALVLHTHPDYTAPGAPPEDKEPMFERLMTGFAIIAVIFLSIVTAIIILSRRKNRQIH